MISRCLLARVQISARVSPELRERAREYARRRGLACLGANALMGRSVEEDP